MLTSKHAGWLRLSLLLGLGLLLVIFITSLSPEFSPPGRYNADKFIHIGFYCLLTFFLISGVADRDRTKYLAIAMAIFLYGVLLEFLQQYIDGRTTSIADIGVNGLGIALALLIKAILSRRLIKTRIRDKLD